MPQVILCTTRRFLMNCHGEGSFHSLFMNFVVEESYQFVVAINADGEWHCTAGQHPPRSTRLSQSTSALQQSRCDVPASRSTNERYSICHRQLRAQAKS
jgi:hypothetical protein